MGVVIPSAFRTSGLPGSSAADSPREAQGADKQADGDEGGADVSEIGGHESLLQSCGGRSCAGDSCLGAVAPCRCLVSTPAIMSANSGESRTCRTSEKVLSRGVCWGQAPVFKRLAADNTFPARWESPCTPRISGKTTRNPMHLHRRFAASSGLDARPRAGLAAARRSLGKSWRSRGSRARRPRIGGLRTAAVPCPACATRTMTMTPRRLARTDCSGRAAFGARSARA